MRKLTSLISVLSLLFFCNTADAFFTEATETDGSPKCYGYSLKFAAGNVTDNGDGTCTVADQSSVGGGNNTFLEHDGSAEGDNSASDITLDATTGLDLTCVGQACTILGETASVTNAGIVELATTAETTTGTDATRAVTPDGLEDGFDGSANITTLGTIATGTWQGTAVADAYVANNITIDDAGIAATITRDSEWDTFAEINAASTDTDAVLDTDIGGTVQAWDAELDTIAALTETNGNVMFVAGGVWTSDATPAINCTDCTNIPAGAPGTDSVGTTELDDDANTPVAGYAVIVETGAASFDYSDLSAVYQPLEATLTDIADGTIAENLVNTANPWADNEVANNLTVDDAGIATTITRDSEWDTLAEINTASTDTDAVLDTDIGGTVQAFGAVLDDFNTLGAASTDGEIIVATGAGAFAYESGATARTSLGLGGLATESAVDAGEYTAASIDGDDVNSNIAGTGLTLTAASPDTLDCDAASVTAVGCAELATTAEIDTGTDTTRTMPVDQFVASKRNIRWLVFNLVEAGTDTAAATNIAGDFVSPIAGTVLQSDTTPFYLYATNSTAGTTGTMVVDISFGGTSIMTTNKLDFDTTEKTTTTAATPPDVTDTTLAVGDIITIDIDSIHTTAAKGLTVYMAIRE